MHPQAFQRLWLISNGQLPHLSSEQKSDLCGVSEELFENDLLHFWGLLAESLRYRGHSILRCYNFGNSEVEYPWPVRIANFGMEVYATITRGGTARLNRGTRSMLESIDDPYLVFEYEADAQAIEYLQSGMLLTTGPGSVEQRRDFDVVLPDGSQPPAHDGLLFYFLLKRIPFTASSLESWVPSGAPAGIPRFRMSLRQPVCMEPGWPILILEKNRWIWGVVA